MKLQGTIIAVATPMLCDEMIDYPRLSALLEWQLSEGCDGIMVAGTTGEAPTLTFDEKKALFDFVQKVVNDRVPVIAGSGTNCTRSTIELTQAAYDAGIRYSLLTCPYYNKPVQNGLFLHYEAIAKALPGMQHILYSIPGRCVIRIETDTVIKLSTIPNIIGLKDSSSSVERIHQLRASCGPEFGLYSSDDEFAFDCVQSGGDGAVSVIANACPKEMSAMIHAALKGDFVLAKQLNERLKPLYQLLFCESNPIPLKALLHHMKKIDFGIRLPLTWLEENTHQSALFSAYEHLMNNEN